MFKYTIKTFDNKEKDTLLYTKEYDSIRNAADALDISAATLSNHLTGKRLTKVLKRYEIEKTQVIPPPFVPSPFFQYFNDMMKMKNDEERFKYMAEKIQENLLQSL